MHVKRLSIYLNDHLAGATGGVELAKRTCGSNEGSEYGPVLDRIAQEIQEDRDTLLDVMERLDISKDQLKVGAGWIAEKLGRFKLNDQLTGYSPLSRLVELEALMLGVTGKTGLWITLRELPPDPRLADIDFSALEQRAVAQRDALEELRRKAALEALAVSED